MEISNEQLQASIDELDRLLCEYKHYKALGKLIGEVETLVLAPQSHGFKAEGVTLTESDCLLFDSMVAEQFAKVNARLKEIITRANLYPQEPQKIE